MFNKVSLGSGNLSLNGVISSFLPQHPKQRIVLGAAIAGLISLVICLTLLAHAQSSQVLLVSMTAAQQQQPQATVATSSEPVTTTSTAGANAAKVLVRLDQSAVAQYTNELNQATWWKSSCSATSMSEIINAYQGTQYHIADILAVEASFQNPAVITADSGLLYPEGIDRTMGYFGFTTTHQHFTLDQLITTANAGTPVMVNFPPATWSGGHFLVVVGGNDQYVHLTDSSKLNMQYMPRDRFEHYWRGFADTFTKTSYTVMGKPTVTVNFINQVLSTYHSPAQGHGQALYDLGIKYHINPAFALSFFGHESTFGTKGEAKQSLSLGNLRCIGAGYEDLHPWCQNNYAWFHSWEDGFEAFYRLMAGDLYNAVGLVTPDQIIPRYAPQQDNNNEAGYITALKKSIDRANAGKADIENFA